MIIICLYDINTIQLWHKLLSTLCDIVYFILFPDKSANLSLSSPSYDLPLCGHELSFVLRHLDLYWVDAHQNAIYRVQYGLYLRVEVVILLYYAIFLIQILFVKFTTDAFLISVSCTSFVCTDSSVGDALIPGSRMISMSYIVDLKKFHSLLNG